MFIQVIRKYLEYTNNNILPPVLCQMDIDHGSLYPNMEHSEDVFLYCLACEYKIHLGINSIQDMLESILVAENL